MIALGAGIDFPILYPFWMWKELGLSEALEAPRRHEHPPRLGHESMERLVPGLLVVVQGVAGRVRHRAGSGLETIVAETELLRDLSVRRFLETHATKSVASGLSPEAAAEDANLLGSHLHYLCNFEIHRRKTFWVEEGLSWMLARTNIDIAGERLRLPFTCFAPVFTDRDTLAIAERLPSKEEHCVHRGRILQVITVYANCRRSSGRPAAAASCTDSCYGATGAGPIPSGRIRGFVGSSPFGRARTRRLSWNVPTVFALRRRFQIWTSFSWVGPIPSGPPAF